jgi:U4/U6 small nuclear ribonucleoprotein PRP3
MSGEDETNGEKRRRKRRWGDASAAAVPSAATVSSTAIPMDSKAKALALQESIRARLEALKAQTLTTAVAVPSAPVSAAKRPAPPTVGESTAKRAKHYELDLSVTGPTFKQPLEPPKPKVNPYLAHQEDDAPEGIETEEGGLDERVQASKLRKRGKALNFVEPGTFTEIAERKRRKAANAEQSGFMSGRKAGQYFSQQTIMTNIYGTTEVVEDESFLENRPEASSKTIMPQVVEWWDMELLPNKLKKQVAAYEGKILQEDTQSQLMNHILESKQAARQIEVLQDKDGQDLQTQCFEQAALSHSKTAGLIQHIVPIMPPGAKDGPEAVPTLFLTKKERKRQRKLRRQEKQRELQDLQAAGLVPAPEPRLTLSNFIRVLGDQAYVDPSQMEQKVMAQMEARQRAHMERNDAAKLTKEQRAAKLARKLLEDTSDTGIHVALFYVKDLSHPYHRTKVDLNAQQNNISGGVIECEAPKLACVICEGGPKAIKRYIRLMTVRMKWKGVDLEGHDDDDEEVDADGPKFSPDNTCELVWTGMATKRFFKGFVFQACEGGMEASKVLRAKGVGHFWDQILAHASGKSDKFYLKLADSDEDEDEVDDQKPSGVSMEEG